MEFIVNHNDNIWCICVNDMLIKCKCTKHFHHYELLEFISSLWSVRKNIFIYNSLRRITEIIENISECVIFQTVFIYMNRPVLKIIIIL